MLLTPALIKWLLAPTLYPLVTPEGTPAGGWQPQSRISAVAALRHFTVDGAYAGFNENDFGRIAPGLLADFVVLSQDITRIAPKDILKTRVLLTVMGGKETYRARGFTAGTNRGTAR